MVVRHSRNLRIKGFDYTTGWFFVTNKANFENSYFTGNIRDLIKSELITLASQTSGVGIDYFHIMPNHIHAILVFEDASLPLSEFWRRYKAITTLKAKRQGFIGKTLWQYNYFEHTIRSEIVLQSIRTYIQNNPTKEDLPLQEIYSEVTTPARLTP